MQLYWISHFPLCRTTCWYSHLSDGLSRRLDGTLVTEQFSLCDDASRVQSWIRIDAHRCHLESPKTLWPLATMTWLVTDRHTELIIVRKACEEQSYSHFRNRPLLTGSDTMQDVPTGECEPSQLAGGGVWKDNHPALNSDWQVMSFGIGGLDSPCHSVVIEHVDFLMAIGVTKPPIAPTFPLGN